MKRAWIYLSLSVLLLAIPVVSKAETRMREHTGNGFSIGYAPSLVVRTLDRTDQAAFDAVRLIPPNTGTLELLEISWPGGSDKCVFLVAYPGQLGTSENAGFTMAVVKDGVARRLDLTTGYRDGFVSRLCVWPDLNANATELLLLVSVSSGWEDSDVVAYLVGQDGQVRGVPTGGARTLYGWYDSVDLDDDGDFELITSRNLDGTRAGFFYHAIREFDHVSASYNANPDNYKSYFGQEVEWLEWVVATKPQIEAEPERYMVEKSTGPIYRASFKGVEYGFDSILEFHVTGANPALIDDYNTSKRLAFSMIVEYKDDLKAWLEGGAYPKAWRLGP